MSTWPQEGPGGGVPAKGREGKPSYKTPRTLSAASLNSCTGSLERRPKPGEGARATNLQRSGILSERPARMIEDVRVEEGHDDHLGQRVGPGFPGEEGGAHTLDYGRVRGGSSTGHS